MAAFSTYRFDYGAQRRREADRGYSAVANGLKFVS